MSDELEYLQPGFDPNVFKVAQLRNLFVQYDISYPSAAKKAELVDLFEERLRPRAKRILAQAARVKRTSMGIEDVPSSIESDDNREPEVAPTPVRRALRKSSATPSAASRVSRASRRSTRTPVTEAATDEEEDEDVARAERESTARSSRRSTRTPMAESETSETERLRTGRRKTRLSDFDPVLQVKDESADDRVALPHESPFSTHNPFQSGSSPVTPGTARRKSTTRKSQSRRRAAGGVRVKQEDEDDDATPVPKSRRSEGPVARLSNGKVKEDRSRTATLEPSEEFTPDEQLALEQEEAATGKAVMPARRKQSRSNVGFIGFWIVLTTLLSAVAVWWRQEKIAVGFCGYGSNGEITALSKSDYQLPEWLEFLQPKCDECPMNAFCYENHDARCQPDHVLQYHPLSLGGLIPLRPTCEPDSEKARKVRSVAERAVAELREQKAMYECGIKDEAGSTVSSPEISEETLKAKVSAKRRRGMTEAEFEALWDGAIEDVVAREEITRVPDGRNPISNHNFLLSSSSLARLPLLCTVRRSARLALARHRIPIASVIAIIAAVAYARYKFLASRTDRARIPGLVSTVLDRLATQAAIHADGRSPEPWISAGQLRDDVLRDEFSAQRRENLWRRVKAVVEMNANVRAGVKEGRSGEVSRVWEWIGAVPALDDVYDRSASRSRLSYGSTGADVRGESRSPQRDDREEGERAHRRWDEGRAVY